MEKQTVEIVIGKKVEEKEAKADTSKKVVDAMRVPPAVGEVQGRSGYVYVRDPWCQAINFVYVDDYQYILYRCWNCAHFFRV